MSTNYNPTADPIASAGKPKSIGKRSRALLAAVEGAAATGAIVLIAPIAIFAIGAQLAKADDATPERDRGCADGAASQYQLALW